MKNIAIVAGGDSSEYGVSLRSAEGILSFMDKEKFNPVVVELRGQQWFALYNGARLPMNKADFSFATPEGQFTFDFAYITIHGAPGENGILQGYFDLIGMPYSTSGVFVEALTFNKFALNNYLRAFPQIHVSDSYVVRKGLERPADAEIIERLGLPCFVKPNAGGSSFGVTKVKIEADLAPAIEKAMNESDEVMMARALQIMHATIQRRDEQIARLKPRADYADQVLDSISCFTVTQIGKELGMTGHDLNVLLCSHKIQYAQSGQYLLYADYARQGLAKNRTFSREASDGTLHTRTYLVWTEKGRDFIHQLLDKRLAS